MLRSSKLNYITELDLFKLSAINLPRHVIVHAMPVSLQVESAEINRMRSYYIKLMIIVWRAYAKNVLGSTCAIMGTFSADGQLTPSTEIAAIAGIEPTPCDELPATNYGLIAKQSNCNENVVTQILKMIVS